MSTEFAIAAQARTDLGKGSSRRLRREQGLIPAVIYGGDTAPVSISLIRKDLVKQLENEAFYAHIIDMNLDGKSERVVLKALQRHPVSNFPVHADFLRIKTGHQITMKIPLHFINDETCPGVKTGGGNINYQVNELEVNCLPKNLPEFIEVDCASLEVGSSLHISDIKLPNGVESVALSHGPEHDLALVAVLPPKGGSTEEGEEETPAE